MARRLFGYLLTALMLLAAVGIYAADGGVSDAQEPVKAAAGKTREGAPGLPQNAEKQPPDRERPTMRCPAGFEPASGTSPEPYTGTGWAKEVLHEATGIEMVFIPAGEFQMGSAQSADEKPVHKVRITKPFYLGKYEVTQGQWQKVTGDNPSGFIGDLNPADRVSWVNCQGFIEKAGDGLRLPTEAEWEYACRAGTTTAYCYGDSVADLGDYAWYRDSSQCQPHPVGRKKPNAWGLHDMHGSVWEWCSDWYGPYPSTSVDDPQGPESGGWRVMRGGCWDFNAIFCRSATRTYFGPKCADGLNGLRVARSLD